MLQDLTLIYNYIATHETALLALVGGGTGLSVLLQVVVHKFNIDSKKVAYTLIHLLSLAGALAAYYLDNQAVLGSYAGLVIAAQTIHRFVVSPQYDKRIKPYLEYMAVSTPQPVFPAEAPSDLPDATFVS
jgi:hypothetical protein